MPVCSSDASLPLEETIRREGGQVLATLIGLTGSFVRVNRVAAVSFADGPEAALALLDQLPESAGSVDGWHLYWSTRADLLRRLGRSVDAAAAYSEALRCTSNDSDRQFLERRFAEVTIAARETGVARSLSK